MEQLTYCMLLYDMALASSGETAVKPLLTKALQRLLYHTGFPCGLYLRSEQGDHPAGHLSLRVELTLCAQHRSFRRDAPLYLPLKKVHSGIVRGEDLAPYAPLFPEGPPFRTALQLPVEGDGLFLLLSPSDEIRPLPYEQLFEPVLANFSNNIHLCRRNESNTEKLLQSIQEHRATLQALRDSETKLKTAQRLGQIGHWNFEVGTAQISWSEELYRILALDPLAFTPGADSLRQHVHPQDREQLLSIRQLLAQGKLAERSYRILRPSGEERHVHETCEVVCDEDGSPLYLHGTVQDVTRQKEIEQEREQLLHQLQRSQRMESLGQLTGGIAHDFNNILSAILGYTNLLQHNLGEQPQSGKLQSYLQAIRDGGERASELVKQMLAFSRDYQANRQYIDPGMVVREAFKLLRTTFPSSIISTLKLEPTTATIHIDPVQLHQVLMNLAINARDAMNGMGELDITMRQTRVETLCSACHTPFGGDYLQLSVQDTGHGIDAVAMEKIFTPFYTTKPIGMGTGLGLSVVHGIVHDCGGHISVNSSAGKGTSISLYFPLVTAPVDGLQRQRGQDDKRNRRRHILVIDDEASVAHLMQELLKIEGYDVTVFTDSREALARFKASPNSFDLVLTDQVMPGMTGLETLQNMFALRPRLPAVIFSGNCDNLPSDTAQETGVICLEKPVDNHELFSAIRDALNRGS